MQGRPAAATPAVTELHNRTMNEPTLLTTIEEELLHNDCGLVVACEDRIQASKITGALYEETPSDVYHIEHYPVIDEDTEAIDYIALIIRKLIYDVDFGWASSDISDTPDIDLREYDMENTQITDSTENDAIQSNVKRFAVAAETVHDMYSNYTLLGGVYELDLTEYDTVRDAMQEAAERATTDMPETRSEIVDTDFRIYVLDDTILDDSDVWVSVENAFNPEGEA